MLRRVELWDDNLVIPPALAARAAVFAFGDELIDLELPNENQWLSQDGREMAAAHLLPRAEAALRQELQRLADAVKRAREGQSSSSSSSRAQSVPAVLVGMMAKGEELGTKGAAWPEEPGEGVATYDVLLRALMTVADYKALQKDAVWGGSGEAWSMAVVAAMGYKSAAAAVVARSAKDKHTCSGLREALAKAKLQGVWSEGVWREDGGEVAGEGGRGAPAGPAIPAYVASWLKANGMVAIAAPGTAPATNRAGARTTGRRDTQ
jgi:hypothetical protein